MRGDVLMNLMELRLQQVLQENRAEFIDSLRLSGIDVNRGGWSADAVDQNAQAGALSLIQFVSQENISDRCRDAFLRTIAGNLDGEERTFVMAWIYAAYEWAGRFPPIQSQFLIFPLIPTLCGFSFSVCSANYSAEFEEKSQTCGTSKFSALCLTALYLYYFFLSNAFCMLFSSLSAIFLPYLSILSSFFLKSV